MSRLRRCETCGTELYQPEYAARADGPAGTQVWCMRRWDEPGDSPALQQYRDAQSLPPMYYYDDGPTDGVAE